MRRLIAAAAAVLLLAAPAAAQHGDHDSDARIVARQPLRAAESALQTEDGKVALLLVRGALVMQMTDRGLAEIGRDMERDNREETGFARFVGNIVRSGVRTMLDRGIEVPLSEIREARFERNRLMLVGRDGKELFQNVKVNDTEVMESFDPARARAFAARVNQARRRADL
jgi:hypothetical protein